MDGEIAPWPEGPRFRVRELKGFAVAARYGPAKLPGLTVWVSDEAYNGRVVWIDRTEEHAGWRVRTEEKMRAAAAAEAERLTIAAAA